MNEFAEGILDLSRHCFTQYITSSRVVTAKPCFLFKVLIAPTTVGTATRGYIRNGETIAADIVLNLGAQYAHPTHDGDIPIYFNRGLYVELNSNVVGVTVQYYREPKA